MVSAADFCVASVYMCVLNGKFSMDLTKLLVKNEALIPYWILLDELLEGGQMK